MQLMTDTGALTALCERLAAEPYITIDTEFMRENTFWPQLCLVQLAGETEAAAIDPLAPGIDLRPLFKLLSAPVLKVFHAARQDIEIFHHLTGDVPAPLFDTQVAAMVCGFGESVGYETLIRELTGAQIDKSSRFTDWGRRPLTDKQIAYALSDVTHLREAYEKLAARLDESGRRDWVGEEMAVLAAPETYESHPELAWKRIKLRHMKPRQIAILQAAAAWRERQAQSRDIPRNRIVRDDTLLQLAAHPPDSVEDLKRMRGFPGNLAGGNAGRALLEGVAEALALPESDLPAQMKRKPSAPPAAKMDLLRVLLKDAAESHDVAAKLIASAADLEALARGTRAGIPALSGWRREVFGNAALDLLEGRLALTVKGNRLVLMPLE